MDFPGPTHTIKRHLVSSSTVAVVGIIWRLTRSSAVVQAAHCIGTEQSLRLQPSSRARSSMAAMIASAEVRPMPLAISTSCSARLPARSLHVASRRCGGSSSTSSVRGLRPPRSAALEDPPSPSFPESSSSSVAVEHVAYEGGAFSATGRLITHADPDAVYQVLTNYEELAR